MGKISAKDHYKKMLTTIKDYYLFIPILVYLIGFLFVQGMFSPLTNSFAIFETIHLIVPVSYELYIVNGLFCSLILFISFTFAYLFYSITIKNIKEKNSREFFGIKYLRSFTNYLKDAMQKNSLMFIYTLVTVLMLILLMVFSIIITRNYYTYLELNVVFFIYFMFLFCLLFALYTLLKTTFKEESEKKIVFLESVNDTLRRSDNSLRERRHNINVSLLLFIILYSFILAFAIYFYGLLSQSVKINQYVNSRGSYELAYVTLVKENRVNSYLYMDYSKDFFIGYSQGKVYMIPSINIVKVEKYQMKNEGSIPKKIKSKMNDAQEKEILDLMNTYYEPFKENKILNANDYIKIFTRKYYIERLDMIAPEILEKVWSMDSELIDFDISIPQLTEKNTYFVYVKEYYRDNKQSKVRIHLKMQDGTWKIDDVSDEYTFNFE